MCGVRDAPDQQVSLTDPDARAMTSARSVARSRRRSIASTTASCSHLLTRVRCARGDADTTTDCPASIRYAESLNGSRHFLIKNTHARQTEASLHILAYNFKRLIAIPGVQPLIAAIQT
jgi:hypothetical protein